MYIGSIDEKSPFAYTSVLPELKRFVLEVRKQDGSEYPPRSLYYIVCGLLRFMRDENIHNMNFLDEKDHRFKACWN